MIADGIELAKDALLRVHAEELRRTHPGLTHARSYQLAQEQHPDLAEEWPEEAKPSPMPAYMPPPPGKVASSGYRYDPEKKHTAPKGTSWNDVLALMGKYARERLPLRVEASTERPILVRGADIGLVSSIW